MRVVRTIADLRETLHPLRSGLVGFVPTMGALHEGHLSLVYAARETCNTVVMSIFVNPTQFNDPADLAAYTRDESRDLELASTAGVDIVFMPEVEEMYPEGFSTVVHVSGPLTTVLEGASRGTKHFDGMATIVTKLFNAVMPDRAYFGAKDAQQSVVVRQLIRDLGLPIELVVCPTSRDADGLARSSRNARLSPEERERALTIPAVLLGIRDAWRSGVRDVASLHDNGLAQLKNAGIVPEYLAFVDPIRLEAVETVTPPTLVLIAAKVGATRLIDNVLLDDEHV